MRSTPRALAARTFSVRNIRLPYVDGIFEKSENHADRRSMETPDEDIVCSRNPECPDANVSAKTREIDFRSRVFSYVDTVTYFLSTITYFSLNISKHHISVDLSITILRA